MNARVLFPAAVVLSAAAGAGAALGFNEVCLIGVAFAIVSLGAWLRVLVRA